MYSDSPLTTCQKIILCALAAMAVIFAIWTAVSRTSEGVQFHDVLLKVSEQGDATVYSGELYGTAVTITCREENGAKLVNFSADGQYYAGCRVEYPEGTITTEHGKVIPRIRVTRNDEVLFSGGYDPNPGNSVMKYYNENGEWDIVPSISAVSGSDPWYHFSFTFWDIIKFAGEPALSTQGSLLIYFAALLCSIFAAVGIIFRDQLFYLSHFLHVKDPEPTEFFYFTHTLGSILLTLYILFLYWKGVHTIV